MALLSAGIRRPSRAAAFLFASGLCLTGCMIAGVLEGAKKPFAFSHRVHIAETGLGCADCHRVSEKGEKPGMPIAQQCALCHDDQDKDKPEDHKVANLFENKQYKAAHAGALDAEVRFTHKAHVAREGEECTSCHAALAESDVISSGMKLDMDACSACHTKKGASNDCAVCHTRIRADTPPASHGLGWKADHGRVFRSCGAKEEQRCSLCHEEASCERCHRAEEPANHTNYFRLRSHGLFASMDRQKCATCHEPDSCERCHSETRPRNHVGSFGAPRDGHCLTCHEPLANETCSACHHDTPSHALGTPKPADHLPSMNCRQCHGNGQPLPHADNGMNCNACHP